MESQVRDSARESQTRMIVRHRCVVVAVVAIVAVVVVACVV